MGRDDRAWREYGGLLWYGHPSGLSAREEREPLGEIRLVDDNRIVRRSSRSIFQPRPDSPRARTSPFFLPLIGNIHYIRRRPPRPRPRNRLRDRILDFLVQCQRGSSISRSRGSGRY